MRDRFYMPIRIPCTLMCGMKGLPPLKNATVGCVSMWTASLASRGGRMCVISCRGHTPYTRGIPWVKSPERVRLTGGRACWRERGHSYRSISSYRKLPPPACPGTTCILYNRYNLPDPKCLRPTKDCFLQLNMLCCTSAMCSKPTQSGKHGIEDRRCGTQDP